MYSSSRSSRTSYANNTNNNNLARDSYIHNNIVKTIGGIIGFIFISSGVLFQLYEQYKTEPVIKRSDRSKNAYTDLEAAKKKKEAVEQQQQPLNPLFDQYGPLPNTEPKEAAAEAANLKEAEAKKLALANAELAKAQEALTQAALADAATAIKEAEAGKQALALVATARKEAETAKKNEEIKKTNYSRTIYPHDLPLLKTYAKQELPLLPKQNDADPHITNVDHQKNRVINRILNAFGAKMTGGGDDRKVIEELIEFLQGNELRNLIEKMADGNEDKMKKMNEQRIVELETLKKKISHTHIDYEIDQVYDLFFPKALESGDIKPPTKPNEKVYETKEELITSMYSYPIDPAVLDTGNEKSKPENNPFGFDSNVQRSNASAWDETMGVELFLLFLKHSGSTDKTSYFGKDGYYDKPMFTNKTTTTRKTPNFLHSGKEL